MDSAYFSGFADLTQKLLAAGASSVSLERISKTVERGTYEQRASFLRRRLHVSRHDASYPKN